MANRRTGEKKVPAEEISVITKVKNKDLVGKRWKQIIDNSTKIFMEKGYHRTSIRDIAKAASLSMGNLYNYIRTKEDVLYLVHQNMIKNVYHNLFNIKEDEYEIKYGELLSIIRNAIEKTFEFQDEIILLYRESGSLSKEMLKSILKLETCYIDMFRRLLDQANKEGLYRISDTWFVANLIVYLISFLSLRRWSLRGYKKEEAVELLMHYITRMLNPYDDSRIANDGSEEVLKDRIEQE